MKASRPSSESPTPRILPTSAPSAENTSVPLWIACLPSGTFSSVSIGVDVRGVAGVDGISGRGQNGMGPRIGARGMGDQTVARVRVELDVVGLFDVGQVGRRDLGSEREDLVAGSPLECLDRDDLLIREEDPLLDDPMGHCPARRIDDESIHRSEPSSVGALDWCSLMDLQHRDAPPIDAVVLPGIQRRHRRRRVCPDWPSGTALTSAIQRRRT